jgi:hypothetical protein
MLLLFHRNMDSAGLAVLAFEGKCEGMTKRSANVLPRDSANADANMD